jgi:hypothetical protein
MSRNRHAAMGLHLPKDQSLQGSRGGDHGPEGISTDSARGPELTGNNRHDSGKPDTRTAAPLPSGPARLPGTWIGISAGQAT